MKKIDDEHIVAIFMANPDNKSIAFYVGGASNEDVERAIRERILFLEKEVADWEATGETVIRQAARTLDISVDELVERYKEDA